MSWINQSVNQLLNPLINLISGNLAHIKTQTLQIKNTTETLAARAIVKRRTTQNIVVID